ncbi:hypothetical protein L3V86_00875 [Thiotrichales bacterium 19S11-10]|nr:hypothetical protein [Thiotrichales bacterium 19S11-10]
MNLKLVVISRENIFSNTIIQTLGHLGAEACYISLESVLNDLEVLDGYDGIVIANGNNKTLASEYKKLIQFIRFKMPLLALGDGIEALILAFGGELVESRQSYFGKVCDLTHSNKGYFINLPRKFKVVKYCSKIIDQNFFPSDELIVSASSLDDKSILGVKHRVYPIEGVLFNPESIGTDYGVEFFRAFLDKIKTTKLNYA